MPPWSTHEIEILIKEIEEMQCFRSMFSPEFKGRIKKSDAWKEVSEVFDRDQIEISFCSLFSNK